MNERTHEDAFNLLCGDLIGSGIHRKVFECRLRPDLVVKVEDNGDWRYFANVHEMKFWNDNQCCKAVAKWLAPCEYMSPDGRILLQRRCDPVPASAVMPAQLPTFLTDLKRGNFGFIRTDLGVQLVCCDYAITLTNPSARMRKVEW